MSEVALTDKAQDFTAGVMFDGFAGDLVEFSRVVERELMRIAMDEGIPTLSQYFVRALTNGIEVGFRGLPAPNVESTGTDLVNEATEAALAAAGVQHGSGRIANTLLAGV